MACCNATLTASGEHAPGCLVAEIDRLRAALAEKERECERIAESVTNVNKMTRDALTHVQAENAALRKLCAEVGIRINQLMLSAAEDLAADRFNALENIATMLAAAEWTA